MKITEAKNKEHDCIDVIIESDIHLNLGNNFTMNHFTRALFEALPESEALIDKIESYNLDDGITIICGGNFSNVQLSTCGNDISDYFRPLNKEFYEVIYE